MVKILSIFSIWINIYAGNLSAAIVTDDEDSISEGSLSSEESEFSQTAVLAYRSNSFNSLNSLIEQDGIEDSQQTALKEQLEDFYSKANSYLFVENSRNKFNEISNLQNDINNKIFSEGRGFNCNAIELSEHRDAIVDDLDTIVDILTDFLPFEEDDDEQED